MKILSKPGLKATLGMLAVTCLTTMAWIIAEHEKEVKKIMVNTALKFFGRSE
jgi:hypothetical protein